jgi:hypothetical protein
MGMDDVDGSGEEHGVAAQAGGMSEGERQMGFPRSPLTHALEIVSNALSQLPQTDW